ncbi:sulfurtransferase-like selenium metabolism protein YedF [Nitratifractor salsuginis]|uniref:Selenium metabolism protein YedF n=1 Tax=Nitratifractor salsuginis (strain DSM 16511 / JCM 12458 / E9I37-1) TaxID=749222 RepID=E6X206_NITSE|nr:sulfurtransferase-like selenium metabolism protein YedF [Nitratifractor salsuginis]ADV47075.1 selenium metabolism protein YedF [Nitratifractor salsuginis DSM 16511]
MRIDCCDLACPEPVLRTKKALEELPENSILEVLVNSASSVANVRRFAENQGYECRSEAQEEGKTLMTIIKGFACEIAEAEEQAPFLDRTLFIKDDKVGEGELGLILMKGFLKTTLEFERLPRNIVFVNRGVFLTTDEAKHGEIIGILRQLQERGVRIYSCGLCMNHYGIAPEALKVGEIGNAYDTMDMLLHTDTVTL